ncbi:MAG: YfjI family protein [Acidocella sp.]|nr:YfjI family protein [Acidocella sp.]
MSDARKILKFDAAVIAQNAVAAATAPPDAKRPLYRDLPPAADYPVAPLGPLRDAAEAIQMKTRAPIEICAQSVLAAAALVIAPRFDVQTLGGNSPLTGLFLTIAESGERKSSVDNLALAAVYLKEKDLAREYEAQCTAFHDDLTAWKAMAEKAKKKNSRAEIRAALQENNSEPKPPAPPMLLSGEATAEGIIRQLREGRPWAGLFSPEGGQMLGGHGLTVDTKTRTASLFNELWDGRPVRSLRAGTGTTFLPGRRFSMHLMAQPGVAEILTHDHGFTDIGLMARLLLVSPASTAGTRFYREAPPECDAVLRTYKARMRELLDKPLPMLGDSGGLDPVVLTLDHDARLGLIAYHDTVERELLPGGIYYSIRGFGSKMAEHAVRLAALLTAYEDGDAVEVGAVALERGTKLATYYASEMKRLADGATIAPDLKLARELLHWWQGRSDRKCHLAEIYQYGPNPLRDAATAKRIVAILEDHGWLKRLPPGTILDGSSRKDSWELNT